MEVTVYSRSAYKAVSPDTSTTKVTGYELNERKFVPGIDRDFSLRHFTVYWTQNVLEPELRDSKREGARGVHDGLCAVASHLFPYLGWLATNVRICNEERSSEISCGKHTDRLWGPPTFSPLSSRALSPWVKRKTTVISIYY
jgi:hypothetical protein